MDRALHDRIPHLRGDGNEPRQAHPPPVHDDLGPFLAVLMFGKVAVGLSGLPKALAVGMLVVISLLSAALVALYYMHLRFETKLLWALAFLPFPLVAILILTVIQEW